MIRDVKECYLCETTIGLEVHHCLHGTGRRKLADEDGLTVYLCHKCHMELHDKGIADHFLQKLAQNYYEFHIGTREQFRERYGKSYL